MVSKRNYHIPNFFTETFLAIETKKAQILMDKPVYFGLSIKFNLYIKADDIYKGIAEDVETRFVTSNHKLDRPAQKGKDKSNWINERGVSWKNRERISWIKRKNL